MTERTALNVEAHAPRPAGSLVEWARAINRLTAGQAHMHSESIATSHNHPQRDAADVPLLTNGDRVAGDAVHDSPAGGSFGYRMAPEVAEHLVAEGLDPDFLGELAAVSGLETRDVLDFAGIDRTTVSRRKASGSALAQGVAVKALQVTDLVTQATEVFGSTRQAALWLTKPHPSLDGETPLRRARTPWGMNKVQSMLVALRYGGAA